MKHFVMPGLPGGRLLGLTADAAPSNTEIRALVEELQRTFKAFADARDQELKELRAGQADVVRTEQVDRINASVGELQAAMDELNTRLAAIRAGTGGGAEPLSAELRAHAEGFDRFFRRGIEADLRQLEIKAALRTDSDPDGGYVVPEQMAETIDRILMTVSAMRGLATVMNISAGLYKKLVNTGGAGYGWVGEREPRPETDTPVLKALEFPAMELYANPAATQTLLDDARVDIGAWLGDEVSTAFAEAEGAAFISGSGVNQPRGILSYDTVADASYAWGKLGFIVSGVAADINDATNNGVDALISLVYALKQGYRMNASWLMNRTLAGKARKLKTIGDTEDYLWQPSTQAGQPATLLGFPVADDDNMSNVGANAFPIAFGDFRRGYIIVDRFGIRVLRDPFTNKPYVHFYTTKRVGGGVQNFEAIKLLKCST